MLFNDCRCVMNCAVLAVHEKYGTIISGEVEDEGQLSIESSYQTFRMNISGKI